MENSGKYGNMRTKYGNMWKNIWKNYGKYGKQYGKMRTKYGKIWKTHWTPIISGSTKPLQYHWSSSDQCTECGTRVVMWHCSAPQAPETFQIPWCITSGQNIIFHQPGFPWNKGISIPQLPFEVRSYEVAIIWPDNMCNTISSIWNIA